MKHINIEIKAKCDSPQNIRKILQSNNAEFHGTDKQTDTYFCVSHGRLKLREGNIENHLIHYNRQDSDTPKQSDVTLYASDPNSSLKSLLTSALGILTVVTKSREIYFIDNVKFHIDTVDQLGSFVEIEAIDKEGTIGATQLHKQCNHFMELLNINKHDLVCESYSDMLLTQSEET